MHRPTHLVHERLREGRLVDLVVSVAPVAHQVHDHVRVEALAPLRRELHGVDHRLDIVAVDVEDGAVECLGHIRAVDGRAGGLGVCSEGHLRGGEGEGRRERKAEGQRRPVRGREVVRWYKDKATGTCRVEKIDAED